MLAKELITDQVINIAKIEVIITEKESITIEIDIVIKYKKRESFNVDSLF